LSLAQTAKQKAPNSPITADALGWAYYKIGSVDLAIAELKECTQKVPANPLYRYHLGMAYMTARHFDLAAQSLRAALKEAPNFQYASSANSALEKIAQQAR
jgi:Flp pilus assembly protein TadD